MLSRRDALLGMATGLGALCSSSLARAEAPASRPRLGLVTYCCNLRRDRMLQQRPSEDLFQPARFLDHCISLGAKGMQIALGALPPAETSRLRRKADDQGCFIEAIVRLPKDAGDLTRFDAELETAARCGALAARTTIMAGRRYEEFHTLDEYRAALHRGRQALQRAVPVAGKHRVPLAVENHKDQRLDERLALLKEIDSEFVGVCVDTGNSMALLEDPVETVRGLAPWAKSVHLKDQALAMYDEGFLLGDIPLGRGCIDLPKVVNLLRQAQPNIRFNLELITRDPLQVPVLTDRYWATFPDLPARDLARQLQLASALQAGELPRVAGLDPKARVALEEEQVRASLEYARVSLGMN